MKASGMKVLAGALVLMMAASQAFAQAYPNKAIRMVVVSAPGGITDIMTRIMAESIGRTLGQSMFVENRPGAGGATAIAYVSKLPPDGYTLVIVNVGNVSIAPWVTKDLPYDPLKDLLGVAPVGEVPSLFAIPDALPVRTLKEFTEYARTRPGSVNYGSAGHSTMPHLAAEMYSTLVGVRMEHVPYKGGLPAAIDLAAGRIQLALLGIGSVRGQLAAKQVRVLAVAAPKRLAALPDVPTFVEAGLNGYDVTNWFGILAPAGTPRDIVQTLNSHISQAFDNARAQEQLTAGGILPMKESVEQFQKRIVSETIMWRDVVRNAGIKPE